MKKRLLGLLILIIVVFTSCDLFLNSGVQYFWTLDDEYEEGDDPLEIDSSSNQKFIMTHGNNDNGTPGYDNEAVAESKKENITFTLACDSDSDSSLVFDNTGHSKTVENHAKWWETPDYHINQIFDVNGIVKGVTYTITGTTEDSGNPENPSNPITATIKVIFK